MNFQQPGSMQQTFHARFLGRAALMAAFLAISGAVPWISSPLHADSSWHGKSGIEIKFLGRHEIGIFDGAGAEGGAAESLSYDPKTKRVFVVNVPNKTIDVIDIDEPKQPKFLFAIDLTPYGDGANSVAVHKGIVAVAVQNIVKTNPGMAVFFNVDGDFLNAVEVGALPDMIIFTPDGKKVLVANEGEPNSYNQPTSVDPEGSVSIIDVSRGIRRLRQDDVVTADFKQFNAAKLDPSIRIFGPNATVAQDLEPECIAVSKDSKEAWVTLQENNAVAHLDIEHGRFTQLLGLGFKDHSKQGNELDASDDDGAINITNWPVKGMYLPDAIATYEYHGKTFLVTANEGDAREWDGLEEEIRVEDLALDPTAFPNGDFLKQEQNLGRLNVTSANGDTDGDGDYDELYAFGGRSFSIWTERGRRVFDSGADFEKTTAKLFPNDFNSDNAENDSFDSRSDNKGPEPEHVTLAKLFGRVYAFIGLERIGGIMVYDITNPFNVSFETYLNTRVFNVDACFDDVNDDCFITNPAVGDLGPEIIYVIEADDSPNRNPLLLVSHETSGTTTAYEIVKDR